MNSNAVRIVNRAADIVGSYGATRTAPEQVEALALANLVATHARQELELFIRYCYQQDTRGRWIHILADGQIPSGVFTPWGSSGKSSLTRTQRDTLRSWLVSQAKERKFPAFVYRPSFRRWYVDVVRKETEATALSWLTHSGLDGQTWLNLSDVRMCQATTKPKR